MSRLFKKPVWIAALVLALTMAVAGSAMAFSNSFSGTASPYARFLVLWGPTPDTASTEIYRSTDYTAGFHATFTKSYFPSDFPGYFRVCARNTATVPAQVTLSQNGY